MRPCRRRRSIESSPGCSGACGQPCRAPSLGPSGGFAWTAVSTPFVRREGDRVVGHAGVIELSLVMAGRVRRIGSATPCAPIPSDGGGAWAARSWKTS
jgi:hypothetical protein